MRSASRLRLAALALTISACAVISTAFAGTTAFARTTHAATAAGGGGKPSVTRFSLAGYVINTAYTLGRNKGNTFQQTYKAGTVHGVPIKGPYVGTKFPVEDYVAMPIGNHELYVAWLDTKTHALLDVFVMNFATRIVYDYAPGSLHPESSGTVTVVKTGSHKAP
ncbi:MAG TPA: hypothetical protein VHX62_10920 [Solirubrobacteraceae bacterium]|jgi:hypothetical protein|nr:hypothetical protein [Solirubrobacteraceae bacterium]